MCINAPYLLYFLLPPQKNAHCTLTSLTVKKANNDNLLLMIVIVTNYCCGQKYELTGLIHLFNSCLSVHHISDITRIILVISLLYI